MNIEEDYCSYEVSKLLKEKGFNEICSHEWGVPDIDKGYVLQKFNIYNGQIKNSELIDDAYAAPTHQMACKWLRENHKLLISVDATPIYGKMKDDKGRNTCGILYWNYIASGEWTNEKYNPIQKAFALSGETYEEAVEAACIYVLKNLI